MESMESFMTWLQRARFAHWWRRRIPASSPARSDDGSSVAPLIDAAARSGQRGCVSEALRALAEVHELDPENAAAWILQAELLTGAGRLPEAELAYVRYLDLVPRDAAALHGYGACLAWGGKLAQAESVLSSAALLEPGNKTFRHTLNHIREQLPFADGTGAARPAAATDGAAQIDDDEVLDRSAKLIRDFTSLRHLGNPEIDHTIGLVKRSLEARPNDLRLLRALAGLHYAKTKFQLFPEVKKRLCEDASGFYRALWRVCEDLDVLTEAIEMFTGAHDFKQAAVVLDYARGKHPAAPRLHRLTRELGRAKTPGIYVVALPKSASVHIVTVLYRGLGKGTTAEMSGAFPHISVCPPLLIRHLAARSIVHSHIEASRYSLLELGKRFGIDQLVVHLRDPRQALVSWIHFIPNVIRYEDPVQREHYDMPADYLEMSEADQIEWNIENWYPRMLTWIRGWIEASEDPNCPCRILFTTFEEMKRDEPALLKKIFAFYEIDPRLFEFPDPQGKPAQGSENFRRGSTDEWKTFFSAAQIDRLNAMLDQTVGERIGWLSS